MRSARDAGVGRAAHHVAAACTLPAELTEGVRTCAASTALWSLQPQPIAAYEPWRYKLPPGGAWFVSIGDGRLRRRAWRSRCRDRPQRAHRARGTRELKRLQTFGRLASHNPEEGRVYVDALRPARSSRDAGRDLHWLEDERPLTTLTRLSRVRRLAA
jgi:hypothetical protein